MCTSVYSVILLSCMIKSSLLNDLIYSLKYLPNRVWHLKLCIDRVDNTTVTIKCTSWVLSWTLLNFTWVVHQWRWNLLFVKMDNWGVVKGDLITKRILIPPLIPLLPSLLFSYLSPNKTSIITVSDNNPTYIFNPTFFTLLIMAPSPVTRWP